MLPPLQANGRQQNLSTRTLFGHLKQQQGARKHPLGDPWLSSEEVDGVRAGSLHRLTAESLSTHCPISI